MSTRTDIEVAVLAWLRDSGTAGGLANEQVIVADVVVDGMPVAARPPPPYLLIKLTGLDEQVGEDERQSRAAGHVVDGRRRAALNVQAHGEGAEPWLERATLHLGQPSVMADLRAAGLTIYPTPGAPAVDITTDLDVGRESRKSRDFVVTYRVVSDPEAEVELQQVDIDDQMPAGSPFTVIL